MCLTKDYYCYYYSLVHNNLDNMSFEPPSIHIWALDRLGRGSGSKTSAKQSPSLTKTVVPCHAWGETTPDQTGHHVCQLVLGKPDLTRRTTQGLSADKPDKPGDQAVP